MAKVLDDEFFNELNLNNAGGRKVNFYHKVENGLVKVHFTSEIQKTEPGEMGLDGFEWDPPITDKNGNPYTNSKGEPRQPWAKFEAEAIVDGRNVIYGLNGERSPLLKGVVNQMKINGLSNKDLPGTNWEIKRLNRFDWEIEYLGKVGTSQPSQSQKSTPPPIKSEGKIMHLLNDYKKSNSKKVNTGVPKDSVVTFIAFSLENNSPTEIQEEVDKLISEGKLSLKDGKLTW